MKVRNLLVSLIILSFSTVQYFAQGICVPDTLAVTYVKGKVLAHLNRGDEPLQNIIIRITKKDRMKKIIKETKTDKDGFFDVGKLKKGSYNLIASYQGLGSFYLNLSLSPRTASVKKNWII